MLDLQLHFGVVVLLRVVDNLFPRYLGAGEVTPGVLGDTRRGEVTSDMTTGFVALCAIYFPSVTGALCPIHTARRDETVLVRWIGQCEWDIRCCWCGSADRI